jgi:hypothetical protein
MEHDTIVHVVHISSRRMIEQGSDDLSRADHSEGVMQGRTMVDYVPLHLDPMEREPRLKTWLDSVTLGLKPEYLGPEGWFDEARTLRAEPSYRKSFAGLCCPTDCRKFLKCNDGIFCANLSSARGPFRPCLSAWCGPCYKPLGHKRYPVMVQMDNDGEVIRNPGEDS